MNRTMHCPAWKKPVRLMLAAAMAAAFGLVLAAWGEPAGRDLYVAPGGSDAASGSKAAPWRSLQKALTALQPGDTLTLRGGVYEEDVRAQAIQPATPLRPIRVRAYPGERPVLKGLLRISRPSYWTFDGLNVQWNPQTGQPREHMVKIGDGVGWTFRNGELSGAQSYAALLVYSSRAGEPRDWRVTGCAIHDTRPANRPNQDHLIYVNSGLEGSGGRIDHNLLYNAPNGCAVKLGGPSATEGGAAGVTVEYNTIVGARQGILIAWQSCGNLIRRNLIGRTESKYGAVRGYQVTGKNNRITENAVFTTRQAVVNDTGFPGLIDEGTNRVIEAPRFDREDPSGFHDRQPATAGFGRYGDGAAH